MELALRQALSATAGGQGLDPARDQSAVQQHALAIAADSEIFLAPRFNLRMQQKSVPLLVNGRREDAAHQDVGCCTGSDPPDPGDVRLSQCTGSPTVRVLARDPRSPRLTVRQIKPEPCAQLCARDAARQTPRQGFPGYEPKHSQLWGNGDARLPAAVFDGAGAACARKLAVCRWSR